MRFTFQSGVNSILLMLLSTPAWASFSGKGQIGVHGSIVDSTCAIATDSREQDVDMGGLPVGELLRRGQGPARPVSIRLVNCVLERAGRPNWETFRITFDGPRDAGNFGAHGTASGVALRIADADGRIVIPGREEPRKNIRPDSMTLNYFITPVANSRPLRPGTYSSVIKFRLDYF